MSAAMVIDIHSVAFWAWADKAYPGSVAATIDGTGMAALHTAGPLYFEAAKRWVTHPQGIRADLSLTQVGDRREGLIAWHPDTYTAALGRAQAAEFGAANRERRSPASITSLNPFPQGSPLTVQDPPAPVAPAIPAVSQVVDDNVRVIAVPAVYTVTDLVGHTPPEEMDLPAVRDALRALLVQVEWLVAKG